MGFPRVLDWGWVVLCDVLVWVAGDVSGYSLVNYVLPGGVGYRSFVSAAALAEAVGPGRLVVLVPETLFEGSYILWSLLIGSARVC